MMTGVVHVHADLMSFQASDFGVFAGNAVSAGDGVQITGRVGALDNLWIGASSTVTGDIYSGNDLSAGDHLTVSGRAMANSDITLGQYASVTRLDALGATHGRDSEKILIGANSTGGHIYGASDVRVEIGGTITGNVHSGNTFDGKNNVVIGGSVWANQDAKVGVGGYAAGDLHAGHNVELKDDAVADGSMFAGNDAKLRIRAELGGSVHAGRHATLEADAAVHGDVTHVDILTMDPSATVDGTITQGTPQAPQSPDAPDSWMVGDRDDGSDPGFDPAGGSLLVTQDDTMNIVAGVYRYADGQMESGAKILADTTAGDVIISVAGDFSTANNAEIDIIGDGNVWIYSGANINLGDNAVVQANLVAFEDMSIGESSAVTGTLYAQDNLSLGSYVTIETGNPAVPEPGTIALLTFGSLGVLFRRHRRKLRLSA